MESEFGQGLTYCLGLFLCHDERDWNRYDQQQLEYFDAHMWFNGASDHLYDLQIPETLSIALQQRLKTFQDKVLQWGHGYDYTKPRPTQEDKYWAVQEAKDLLLAIDTEFHIPTIKGTYE